MLNALQDPDSLADVEGISVFRDLKTHPLPDELKAQIAAEIEYAPDIDIEGLDMPWESGGGIPKKCFPRLSQKCVW
ncbi:MAG: hypothetical protein LBT59_07405 [Clostridiales bacterium]|nr:hypothetical protein [Clostridiales bacterium]